MAKQDELESMAELLKLTQEDFYDWLFQFDAMDVLYATEDIANLYIAQKANSSSPKEKGA